MKTIIVSAFPGTGKSYFCENNQYFNCLDSDSSQFSWLKDENGNNTKERNPNFPQNYIEHIKQKINDEEFDIIFVSSHKQVRDALISNCIEFKLVYPNIKLKNEYIERFKKRKNDDDFINFMSKNWDVFINEMKTVKILGTKYELKAGEYINSCSFTWVEQ